ncbi:hypothetical protein CYMTET_23530 [Cymbomonas tetramitiformis]|uniref:PH domain-containing protein n=1 Tax=Cymbomonas tetramitiformis TaxID=36881 RepID=A0AAE0FY56_9CHLO|nr:hypothetical protein CYMTET_23530 [Cymbomonas tetramitiformis]
MSPDDPNMEMDRSAENAQVLCGYLRKKGVGFTGRTWRLRYIVVNEFVAGKAVMRYQVSRDSKEILGQIALYQAYAVKLAEGKGYYGISGTEFIVECPHRIYQFCAETAAVAYEWVEELTMRTPAAVLSLALSERLPPSFSPAPAETPTKVISATAKSPSTPCTPTVTSPTQRVAGYKNVSYSVYSEQVWNLRSQMFQHEQENIGLQRLVRQKEAEILQLRGGSADEAAEHIQELAADNGRDPPDPAGSSASTPSREGETKQEGPARTKDSANSSAEKKTSDFLVGSSRTVPGRSRAKSEGGERAFNATRHSSLDEQHLRLSAGACTAAGDPSSENAAWRTEGGCEQHRQRLRLLLRGIADVRRA